MKSAAQHNRAILPLLIAVALVCLWLFPQIQAAPQVAPAPDGCYPGFTTAEGCNALQFLGAGAGNTGVGWYSLYLVGGGNFNTGVGAGTLVLNTGDSNTAVGAAALLLDSTGSYNNAFGAQALTNHTSGDQNNAFGAYALLSDHLGIYNNAFGYGALATNVNGINNTAVGDAALTNSTSSNNTALGAGAGINATTGSFNVYIGSGMQGVAAESNACYIASIFGQSIASGTQVYINSANKLGTITSSKRFKEDIKPMEKSSEALFSLKPVIFRYKKEIDPVGTPQLGLVAEDVEKVNPDLVTRDKEGKLYSVRYDQVNAMLLNEFLKEHRKVEAQDREMQEQKSIINQLNTTVARQAATITQQQKGMDLFATQLKEQAAQIQKVSAQIEVNKAAPQVACLPAVASREGGNNP